MNRRDFLGRLAAASFGFSILPPATTYGRIWRATRSEIACDITYGVQIGDRRAIINIVCDDEGPLSLPPVGRVVADGRSVNILYQKKPDGLWARIQVPPL